MRFEGASILHFRRSLATLILAVSAAPVQADTTLGEAIRGGDTAQVEQLLRDGLDVDQRENLLTPLTIAAIRGNIELVELLLGAGADPDLPSLNGGNALSMAVRSCRSTPELVDMLIRAGADLEDRSGEGITPLMLAIQENRTSLALQLIDHGSDIQTLNLFGEGPLNYAIYTENSRLIGRLLELGASTAPLSLLFTTVEYDPPGIGEAQAHHDVLCE